MHYESVFLWFLIIAVILVVTNVVVIYNNYSNDYGPALACDKPSFKSKDKVGIQMYVACGDNRIVEVGDKEFVIAHLNSPRQFTCEINKLGLARCVHD